MPPNNARGVVSGHMALVLCPFCVLPVDERASECPTCFADLEADALLEMDLDEWLGERKPCPKCLKAVHPLAVSCPFCNTKREYEA